MKHFRTILLLLLMALLIIFAVANRQPVPVNFWPFFGEWQMRLFYIFFIGVFFGIALSAIFIALRGARHYVEMRAVKKEASKLSGEVDSLEKELDQKPAKVDQKDYGEESPSKTTKLAKKD